MLPEVHVPAWRTEQGKYYTDYQRKKKFKIVIEVHTSTSKMMELFIANDKVPPVY